jgi:predicted transcriptional regulator
MFVMEVLIRLHMRLKHSGSSRPECFFVGDQRAVEVDDDDRVGPTPLPRFEVTVMTSATGQDVLANSLAFLEVRCADQFSAARWRIRETVARASPRGRPRSIQ